MRVSATIITEEVRIGETMNKFFATIIAVLCLIFLVTPAIAAPTAAAVPIPFKGAIQETSETHQVIMPYFYVNGNGMGNATHLGLYTYSFQAKVHLPDRVGEGVSAHFIAANGDSLFAKGYGSGVPTDTPNINLVTEYYTITGGTGRFAGASGSFVVVRTVNTITLEGSGMFEGNIILP
jgi:hypothetical protein